MKWTPEQRDRIRILLAEGLSMRQIAARFGDGFNRNMVIGVTHRHNLHGYVPEPPPPVKPAPKPFTLPPDKSVLCAAGTDCLRARRGHNPATRQGGYRHGLCAECATAERRTG